MLRALWALPTGRLWRWRPESSRLGRLNVAHVIEARCWVCDVPDSALRTLRLSKTIS